MAYSTMKLLITKYPLARGILAYSITWPTGSIIHQTMDGKRWDTYDWTKCMKFALYGGVFVAPTLYGFVKITSRIWPGTDIRTAMIKTAIEQVSYGPFALTSFFFIMSIMDHKTVEDSKQEVVDKFWPAYKFGVFYWTIIQTVNYTLIPLKNRLPFTSFFGLVWTTFLAYMKQKSTPYESKQQNIDYNEHSALIRKATNSSV